MLAIPTTTTTTYYYLCFWFHSTCILNKTPAQKLRARMGRVHLHANTLTSWLIYVDNFAGMKHFFCLKQVHYAYIIISIFLLDCIVVLVATLKTLWSPFEIWFIFWLIINFVGGIFAIFHIPPPLPRPIRHFNSNDEESVALSTSYINRLDITFAF